MTTYTYEDLQLRVTLAPWRKAQLPQWDDAEWRIHLHHECVLYLNGAGKAKVFGATIEDLADRGMTEWDKAGAGSDGPAGLTRPGKPVHSVIAAPAGPYEPVGTVPQRGDRIVCLINPRDSYPWVARLHEEGARFASEDGTFEVRDIEFTRFDDKAWRILKRQAAPAPATVSATAGLQVWRSAAGEFMLIPRPDGKVAVKHQGTWTIWRGDSSWDIGPTDTRLPAAEEAREIKAAREAGVL